MTTVKDEIEDDDIEDSGDDAAPATQQLTRIKREAPTAAKTDAATQTTPWTELAPPRKAEDLAVNPKKVDEVRRWLRDALADPQEHTLLILSGPAGVGKTATVEALARELKYDVVEWQNPMSDPLDYTLLGSDHESLVRKFDRFLSVSDTYASLDFGVEDHRDKVIVVEDLPNVFGDFKVAFQESISRYLFASHRRYPLVLIVTEIDTGQDVLTVRTLLPKTVLEAPNTRHITFNEIAKTFMSKALIRLVDSIPNIDMSTALIDEVADHTNGDIRCAINALQFISPRFIGVARKRPKRKRGEVLRLTADEEKLLNIVTNRESSLGYFHAMGKVVYNKDTGNDPSVILDESATEPGFFLLGIARNYTDSCATVEQAADVMESLSWFEGCAKDGLWSQTRDFATLTEIASYAAVLGVQVGLPSNVKRSHAIKLFYPAVSQIRRQSQQYSSSLDRVANGQTKHVVLLEQASYERRILEARSEGGGGREKTLRYLTTFKVHVGLGKSIEFGIHGDDEQKLQGQNHVKQEAVVLDELDDRLELDDEIEEV